MGTQSDALRVSPTYGSGQAQSIRVDEEHGKVEGERMRRTLAHSTFSLLRLRSPHSVLLARVGCLLRVASCTTHCICTPSLRIEGPSGQFAQSAQSDACEEAATAGGQPHPSRALMASSPSRLSIMYTNAKPARHNRSRITSCSARMYACRDSGRRSALSHTQKQPPALPRPQCRPAHGHSCFDLTAHRCFKKDNTEGRPTI